MIEEKVQMDLSTYRSRQMGSFTTRQIICIALSAVLDVILYFGILRQFHASMTVTIVVLMFCDAPILAFTLRPYGLNMEVYLKHVLLRAILAPVKRKMQDALPGGKDPEYSDQEKKASVKKMNKLKKNHPEYVPYQ